MRAIRPLTRSCRGAAGSCPPKDAVRSPTFGWRTTCTWPYRVARTKISQQDAAFDAPYFGRRSGGAERMVCRPSDGRDAEWTRSRRPNIVAERTVGPPADGRLSGPAQKAQGRADRPRKRGKDYRTAGHSLRNMPFTSRQSPSFGAGSMPSRRQRIRYMFWFRNDRWR